MKSRDGLRRPLAAACSAIALVLAGGTVLAAPGQSTSSGLAQAAATLVALGVSGATVHGLGTQAAVLAQLLGTGAVPPDRAAIAADSLLGLMRRQASGAPPAAVGRPRPAALPPIGDCASGGGASYDVFTDASPGYTVESGTVQLGSTLNADPSNDAFYASLGAYTAAGSVDVGIWTGGTGSSAGPTWYGYANGTLTPWSYSTIAFAQGADPDVILSLLVGNDSLTLDVWNAQTAVAIGTATFTEAGYGFTAQGGGVGLYRFDSLAQTAENLSDGSSLTDQTWSGVAATPAGATAPEPVTSAIVGVAGPECSRAEQRTVQVLAQTEWYASAVSIAYGKSGTGGGGGHGGHK